jgi:nickel transport protein
MPIQSLDRNRSPSGGLILNLVVAIGLILFFQSVALAHKVYIFAWLEGDTVYVESYFGSKKKVQGSLIQVFDLSGEKLLEGRTNERGEFSFKSPQKDNLRIVVDTGTGHKNEYILKAEELTDSSDVKTEAANTDEAEAISSSPALLEAEQIRIIVEQALESQLKPIRRELARSRKEKGPGFTEVVGGVGYIFGLMGVIMYFRSRKKR